MASRNIFSATPTKKSRKTTEFVHGEVLGHCVVDGCNNAEVTRCCATFGGCKNYATNGCKFKISILSSPSPCTTCLVDIKPGVRCLGVPNPKAEKTASGKTAYVNTHLDWGDCLGDKVVAGDT